MYYIKKSEWEKLEKEHPGYCGKIVGIPETRIVLETAIPENSGKYEIPVLLEGKHFQIVDDTDFTERETRETETEPVDWTAIDEQITEYLWGAACGGEIEVLRSYYNGGGKIGRRYTRFGKNHSLIAGAYRNGKFETARYLLQVGEKPENHESDVDLTVLYIDDVIKAAENLLEYFKYYKRRKNS